MPTLRSPGQYGCFHPTSRQHERTLIDLKELRTTSFIPAPAKEELSRLYEAGMAQPQECA